MGRLPPEGVTVAGGSGRDPGGVHGDGSRWTGVYKQQQPQQQQHTFLLFAKLTVDITQRYVVPTLIPVAISYLLEATRSIGMVLRASEEFSPPPLSSRFGVLSSNRLYGCPQLSFRSAYDDVPRYDIVSVPRPNHFST